MGYCYIGTSWSRLDSIYGQLEFKNDSNLNAFGRIVRAEWEGLPRHLPNICLDAFVVMPNHIHGVIIVVATRQPAVGATRHLPDVTPDCQ